MAQNVVFFCGNKSNKDILTVMHHLIENKAKDMPKTGLPKLMCYLIGIVTNVIKIKILKHFFCFT